MNAEAALRATPTDSLTPADARLLLQRICANVERALQGKRRAVELAVCAVAARGHLLIEDAPGMGKTTLAQAIARSFELSFSRIQFTSDLLPADILGAQVFDPRTAAFSFRPGPIFAQVVLADELNRAPPRAQSALLEAMADFQVSLDGTSHLLPRPFVVLATQNPREQVGTYPLPDSQLDRFLLRIALGHPDAAVERAILLARTQDEPARTIEAVASAADLLRLEAAVAAVKVDPSVAGYIVALVNATRETPLLSFGASTRGALAVQAAAKAHALLEGRGFLLPDDVKALAIPCLAHRVAAPSREMGESDRGETERALREVVDRVEVPE